MKRCLCLILAVLLGAAVISCTGPVQPSEPRETEPEATEGSRTESVPTEPKSSEPVPTEPQSGEPAPSEAATTQPSASLPEEIQPGSSSGEEPTAYPYHPTTEVTFTKENYPRIDGATGMYPMSVEIARAVIGLSEEEAEEFITHHTTANAYYNLIDRTVDLIFVSEPSDDILRRAAEAGVTFEMVGIGRDGFVFVINRDNPVRSLTLDQIRKIYTGEITSWKEVGGEDREILAYQREPNSGSQNLMEKMVMKGLPMAKAPAQYVIESMAGLIDSVAAFENSRAALGYSIYLYAKDQYVRDSIEFLSIDGVYPTDDSIADGSYPLSKIVYAVFRSDEPEDSAVRRLVAWLGTEEGQEAVTAGGYVGYR